MSTAARTKKPAPSAARQLLVDAARGLLLRGGPRAVTVHRIAEVVGVSPPALYMLFVSRAAVMAVLSDEARALFRVALVASLPPADPLSRLLRCGENYLAFGLAEPQRYRLLFANEDDAPEAPRERGESDVGAGLQFLMALVRDCQAAGQLPTSADPQEIAIAYWATCHGLVSLYLSGGGAARFEEAQYLRLAKRSLRLVVGAPP